ncbi:MAG: hypothetical protein HQK66_07905 [Desulfamplus sp.]|nr:hypothetical protein [Desulfamplus sp.]
MNGLYCPDCFGDLEKVFPLGKNGLRETPDDCMYLCAHKTPCLRAAMAGSRGVPVREEMIERDKKPGIAGFLQRWSRKKSLYREKK